MQVAAWPGHLLLRAALLTACEPHATLAGVAVDRILTRCGRPLSCRQLPRGAQAAAPQRLHGNRRTPSPAEHRMGGHKQCGWEGARHRRAVTSSRWCSPKQCGWESILSDSVREWRHDSPLCRQAYHQPSHPTATGCPLPVSYLVDHGIQVSTGGHIGLAPAEVHDGRQPLLAQPGEGGGQGGAESVPNVGDKRRECHAHNRARFVAPTPAAAAFQACEPALGGAPRGPTCPAAPGTGCARCPGRPAGWTPPPWRCRASPSGAAAAGMVGKCGGRDLQGTCGSSTRCARWMLLPETSVREQGQPLKIIPKKLTSPLRNFLHRSEFCGRDNVSGQGRCERADAERALLGTNQPHEPGAEAAATAYLAVQQPVHL